MADLSALFFLVAIVHGDAFSITELATYPTRLPASGPPMR